MRPGFVPELSEPGELSRGWSGIWLQVQDPVQIFLGGVKVIDGPVNERQTAYNARSHAVTIRGESTLFDIHVSSAIIRNGGELKNVTFQAVANKVLEPYGFTYKAENLGEDAQRPFDRVSLQQGETTFQLLARLASMRGILLTDDNTGRTLIGAQAHGAGARQSNAQFVEGKNILAANVVLQSRGLNSPTRAIGQAAPQDNGPADRAQTSAVAAEQTNPLMRRWKPLVIQMPEPGTQKDAQAYADRAVAHQIASFIYATVTVQGWFDRSGDIYDINRKYTVDSPMALLNGTTLISQVVTFIQDENGTKTTLRLVNEAALQRNPTNLSGPPPGSGADPTVQPNTGSPPQLLQEGQAAQAQYRPSGV